MSRKTTKPQTVPASPVPPKAAMGDGLREVASYSGTTEVRKTSEPLQKGYRNTRIVKSDEPISKRVLIGIPATGLVRIEWVLARYGQVVPCNWGHTEMTPWIDQYSPLGFMVADARNLVASRCVEEGYEWLWFIDHDVVMPPYSLLKWNEYMIRGDVPVFGGLYFVKGVPSEPLVYRGKSNSYFKDWTMGDKVWVDGMGMGNTVIHRSLLEVMYKESEQYRIGAGVVRRIFETPAKVFADPQGNFSSQGGTEDLAWCDRVIKQNVLARAGWKTIARKRFPFLIDTGVFCRHIDNGGVQYPCMGEEQKFMKSAKR